MNTDLIHVRITDKQTLADQIVSLELKTVDGSNLPDFAPGAHIDMHLPGAYIRQFSLYSSPTDTSAYRVAILREPESRGGSIAVHDYVRVDDTLNISAPRNHFGLVPATKSLFFAGGIGVTPILCMVESLAASGANFELHYSCRTRTKAAFLERLQPLGDRVHLHFDDEPVTSQSFELILSQQADKQNTHVYACGPSGYIQALRAKTLAAGFTDNNFHFEHFSLSDDDKPVITDEDFAFQVELASTGEIFDIPADESITSALDRQGVYIPVSCEEGICGTCLTGIVSGEPDHRDTYLTEEEHALNDQFTPCCSRSKGPKIILDL